MKGYVGSSTTEASATATREQEKLLQPIYIALERRNYNRAIKLSQEKTISCLPIVIALRAHAFERSGRGNEAIQTLSELQESSNKKWQECESTISVMAVTLKSCQQFEMLTQMYSKAAAASENMRQLQWLHHSNLVGLFSSYLTLALQLSFRQQDKGNGNWDWMTLKLDVSNRVLSVQSLSEDPRDRRTQVGMIRKLASCYEAMQGAAMKLARGFSNSNNESGQNTLYWSWTVWSILLHCHALQQLLRLQRESVAAAAENDEQIALINQKCDMLPRLAETLCQTKILTASTPVHGEDWKLYLRSLLVQSKYSEALHVLEHQMTATTAVTSSSNNFILQLSERERKELLIQVSFLSKNYATSLEHCVKELQHQPQQWSCCMAFLANMIHIHDVASDNGELDEGALWTEFEAIVAKELSNDENNNSSLATTRGLRLFQVEIAAAILRRSTSHAADFSGILQNHILSYIKAFAHSASCVYHDLKPYLSLWIMDFLAKDSSELIQESATEFLKNLCALRQAEHLRPMVGQNSSQSVRQYTIICQIFCYIKQGVLLSKDFGSCNKCRNRSFLLELLEKKGPQKEEMFEVWNCSLPLSTDVGIVLDSKEGLIGDELIVCIARSLVLQALHSSLSSRYDCISMILMVVAILEHALIQSPCSASISLTLIQLHNLLGSSRRSYQLFTSLNVKQVQNESLSYLILQSCSQGAMFGEILGRCGAILQLHRSTSTNDVPQFAIEALQNSNYTAAIDMIQFQTQKMNCSVQLLHAKAMIMDLAPLIAFSTLSTETTAKLIGNVHGLVGDTTDEERALQMLAHSSDRYAAPSIVKEILVAVKEFEDNAYSDNRDLTVCELVIAPEAMTCEHCSDIARLAVFPSKKELILSSLSVGHIHAIMVYTTMLMSAVKPLNQTSNKKKSAMQHNKKRESNTSTAYESVTAPLQQQCERLRQVLKDAKDFFCFFDSHNTCPLSNALRCAFLHLTDSLLLTCEMYVNDPSSISAAFSPSQPLASAVLDSLHLAAEQIDSASVSASLLRGRFAVKDCSAVLVNPTTLTLVSTVTSQRLVSILAALRNLKRLFSLLGISFLKSSRGDDESVYSNVTQSFVNLIRVMKKSLESEHADLFVENNSSMSSSRNSSVHFLQSLHVSSASGAEVSWSEVYFNAASLVSKCQTSSTTVLTSIWEAMILTIADECS